MVGKLYRHEFAALFKWILPICAMIVSLSLLLCAAVEICYCLPTEVKEVSYIFVFLITMSVIFMISALTTASYVVVLIRLYKNLLAGEGYLTFSLPVTPTTHLVCKLLCGAVAYLFCNVITVASIVFIVWIVLPDMFSIVWEMLPAVSPVSYIIYGAYALVSLFFGLLMPYAAMCMGQLAKKHKIPMAVLWYFIFNTGVSFITQAVSIVCMITTWSYTLEDELAYMNTTMAMYILPIAVVSIVFFLISRYILNNRLNLE